MDRTGRVAEQKQQAEAARAVEAAALLKEREAVAAVAKLQSEAAKQQEELRLKADEEVCQDARARAMDADVY